MVLNAASEWLQSNPLVSYKALYLENINMAGSHVQDCKTNTARRREPYNEKNLFMAVWVEVGKLWNPAIVMLPPAALLIVLTTIDKVRVKVQNESMVKAAATTATLLVWPLVFHILRWVCKLIPNSRKLWVCLWAPCVVASPTFMAAIVIPIYEIWCRAHVMQICGAPTNMTSKLIGRLFLDLKYWSDHAWYKSRSAWSIFQVKKQPSINLLVMLVGASAWPVIFARIGGKFTDWTIWKMRGHSKHTHRAFDLEIRVSFLVHRKKLHSTRHGVWRDVAKDQHSVSVATLVGLVGPVMNFQLAYRAYRLQWIRLTTVVVHGYSLT